MPNIIIVQNDYNTYKDLRNVINYVCRSDLVGAYAADPCYAYTQFVMVKEFFQKRDHIQLKHFILAFSTWDSYRMTLDECLRLGFVIGKFFNQYQLVYAVHTDTMHIHLHVVMNTTSFVSGKQYSDGINKFKALQVYLRSIFPKSFVGLYRTYSLSEINRYSYSSDDELLMV